VEELYGTWYQSGSFSLINVGNGFRCLRSLSFLFIIHKNVQRANQILSQQPPQGYHTETMDTEEQPTKNIRPADLQRSVQNKYDLKMLRPHLGKPVP